MTQRQLSPRERRKFYSFVILASLIGTAFVVAVQMFGLSTVLAAAELVFVSVALFVVLAIFLTMTQ